MIIGIHVFHDRNLSDNSKLVYAHIIASCLNSKDGFCKDTDAEVAKVLGKSKTVIKNSIQQLIEQKHINCEVIGDIRLTWVDFPYTSINNDL